jgi:hypothetical protein
MRTRVARSAILLLALLLMACGGSPLPIETPVPEAPTATQTVEPADTPGSQPTETPTEEPTVTPTAEPTEVPTAVPTATSVVTSPPTTVPGEAMALYAAGSQEGQQLFALSEGGAVVEMGLDVYPGAVASGDGRWVASPGSQPPAGSVLITDLQGDTGHRIPATDGWGIYGLAFDRAGTRLAFLELAPAQVENIPWAIVVVDLDDGSMARFEDTTVPAQDSLPGRPLGWTAAGDRLLVNTYLPYSDGLYAGVLSIELPPGAESAALDDLHQRELIPGGEYLSLPALSPDGTRLVYLARDRGYMPADYEPVEDFAVNQLWTFHIEDAEATMLYEVTDGDALALRATWSPDGQTILFARGHYGGMYWRSLTLQLYTGTGDVAEIAPVPLPEALAQLRLRWCRSDTALVTVTSGASTDELYAARIEAGALDPVASEETVFILGCIFD